VTVTSEHSAAALIAHAASMPVLRRKEAKK